MSPKHHSFYFLSNHLYLAAVIIASLMILSCDNSPKPRVVIKEEPGKLRLLNDPTHTLRSCDNTNKIIAIFEGLRSDYPEDSILVEIHSDGNLLSKYNLSLLNSMYRNNKRISKNKKYLEQPIYLTLPTKTDNDTLDLSITVTHPEKKVYTKKTQVIYNSIGDEISYFNYDQSKPYVKYEHTRRLPNAMSLRKNTSYSFGQDLHRKVYRDRDSVYYSVQLKNPISVDDKGKSKTYSDPAEIIFSYPKSIDLEDFESSILQNKPVGHSTIRGSNMNLPITVTQKTDPEFDSYPAYIFYSWFYATRITGNIKACNKIDTITVKKIFIPEQISTTFKVDSTAYKKIR